MVLAHDQLGVDENIAAEYQGGDAAVDELAGAAVGEEGGHEAEQDKPPQAAEQVRHPAGKVILGLAGEGGQEDEDAARKQHGVEHDRGLVEGYDDGDGIRLEQGEASEEEKVGRVGVALPVGE